MLLLESGKFSLDDPIEKYLPEFRGLQIADSGRLRVPPRQPTILNLLTHSSGIPVDRPKVIENLTRTMDRSLAEVVRLIATQPLDFAPGEKWRYSSSGFATLGRIIEVVSNQSFQSFMDQKVFAPLGMQDSSFFPGRKEPGEFQRCIPSKIGRSSATAWTFHEKRRSMRHRSLGCAPQRQI
jgi:CubicO group peptidase (beta-lactamase class C family)